MPKGLFTQGLCVLLERVVSRDEVEAALPGADVIARREAYPNWTFSGPTLVVPYRREANGLVTVDVVDRPWPDDMGDPRKNADIFQAWAMGHFGPFTFPGALERAARQAWTWDEAKTMPERHAAFLRVRASYSLGSDDDAPIMPADYESLPELEFVTKLTAQLLDVPAALCYFNPNGELLQSQDGLRETLNYGWSHKLPPLDAWSNVRLHHVNDNWSLMDTVGNGQLDIPDVEACFASDGYDYNDVGNFLRNVSLYLVRNGEVINDGDTMDGPGGRPWRTLQCNDGLLEPPRPTFRWFPKDDRSPPDLLLKRETGE